MLCGTIPFFPSDKSGRSRKECPPPMIYIYNKHPMYLHPHFATCLSLHETRFCTTYVRYSVLTSITTSFRVLVTFIERKATLIWSSPRIAVGFFRCIAYDEAVSRGKFHRERKLCRGQKTPQSKYGERKRRFKYVYWSKYLSTHTDKFRLFAWTTEILRKLPSRSANYLDAHFDNNKKIEHTTAEHVAVLALLNFTLAFSI